jgi:3-hydroxyisobutyrate dehydrogenase-like beta-hydroxyacid dehydrogenase
MSAAIKTVGVIGAGRMGLPIIGHLASKGFSVLVHDLDLSKKPLIAAHGANWSDTSAELAEKSDAILICVGFDRELRELISANGILSNIRPDTIVAVLSTVLPETMSDLSKIGDAQGIHVIDSTVCRGGHAADTGTLLSFVAGDEAVVERLRPVLAAYSTDIIHTGKVGTAQVAKAANNLILWACLVADHEALALAKRFGMDVEVLRQALLISSANNCALKDWGSQSMAWAQDDMAIVGAMADQIGISLPQAGVVREVCRTLKPRRYKLDEYGV